MNNGVGSSLGQGTISSGLGTGSNPSYMYSGSTPGRGNPPPYRPRVTTSNGGYSGGFSCSYSPAYGGQAPITQTDVDVAATVNGLLTHGEKGIVFTTNADDPDTPQFKVEVSIVDGPGPHILRALHPGGSGFPNSNYPSQSSYIPQFGNSPGSGMPSGPRFSVAPSSGVQGFPSATARRSVHDGPSCLQIYQS
jgi:hypothetical protein